MTIVQPVGGLAVVDPDVFSYIWKRNRHAERYVEYLAQKTFVLSFQTVAELL